MELDSGAHYLDLRSVARVRDQRPPTIRQRKRKFAATRVQGGTGRTNQTTPHLRSQFGELRCALERGGCGSMGSSCKRLIPRRLEL